MENLYKFDTLAKYNDKKGNLPYINVSYVSENDTVYYNDEKSEIEQQPLTITIVALESGYTDCALHIKFEEDWGDEENRIFKYKVNDNDWVNAPIFTRNLYINDLNVDDQVQLIANFRQGLRSANICYNNSESNMENGAKFKYSGNWFSAINAYDYAINPHFNKNENDDWDRLYNVAGENSDQICDISDLWIPLRRLKRSQYYAFYSGLQNLTGTTDIRLVVNDDTNRSFQNICVESNITTATIGVDHCDGGSFQNAFDSSAITTLTIEKLNKNLTASLANNCQNLTTIYNYSKYGVQITNDFNSIPQSGTLYYVDYGQDMQYTPSSMVPSGWTCTAIQNPNT